jgi:hemerythrin
MPPIAQFNQQANASTDQEHLIQLELLQALGKAATDGTPEPQLGELLRQLIDYSEAHFMSEELLMRMKSYEGYDDHINDHVHMMDTFAEVSAAHAAGNLKLVGDHAATMLEFIGQHIATRDHQFAEFLRNGS